MGHKISSAIWGLAAIARLGTPGMLLAFNGGVGDHILCTAVLRELKLRGHRKLWMMSPYPELFLNNDDVDVVVPRDRRYLRLAQELKASTIHLSYADFLEDEDRDVPPTHPIISLMCRAARISGTVSLRPYLRLLQHEETKGKYSDTQIAIQSSGLNALYPMQNKEWDQSKFQDVVDALKSHFEIVQIGHSSDPPLQGVLDLRGRTTLRETAAVMSQALVFIGLVGGMMHLARAVDCRSVIIYGGRERPWQSGYACNENLWTNLSCSPCWLRNRCDYDRECTRSIQPDDVIDAVFRQTALRGNDLPVDSAEVD